jgi:hypothetical protein
LHPMRAVISPEAISSSTADILAGDLGRLKYDGRLQPPIL